MSNVRRRQVRFRSGQLGDTKNLAALAIQVWLHTYATDGVSSPISEYVLSEFTVEKFAALVSDPSCVVFVAEIEGNLVGYAIVNIGTPCPEFTSASAELATLYVQEHFIGKGVGSSLLKQAELWARHRAESSLWLTVNSNNTRAQAFYARHRYTAIGITYFKLGHKSHENIVLVGRDA